VSEDPRPYMRIAAGLRAEITAGKLKPGNPAPAIREISGRHGECTRQTVSKALRLLLNEGLLIRYPGMGYYVADLAHGGQDREPPAT
jgi:DNA-binding GntR family transcriptional regulator